MTILKWASALALSQLDPRTAWRGTSAAALRRVELRGCGNELPGMVLTYLNATASVLWRPTGPFALDRVYSRLAHEMIDVSAEDLMATPTLFLYKRIPIMLSAHRGRKGEDSGTTYYSELTFFRGSVDVDALLQNALMYCSVKMTNNRRFTVKRRTGRGVSGRLELKEDSHASSAPSLRGDGGRVEPPRRVVGYTGERMLGLPRPSAAADWIWWSPAATLLREDARRWRRRQQWCAERGIPWRRAWMSYGGYGDGKTQTMITVAEELDLPVYALNVATMSSDEFEDNFASAARDAPSMVLVEDLHDVFDVDKNKVSDFGVSMSTVLNCLSGASRYQGMITAFTTNNIATVDPALCKPLGPLPHEVSRPDRVDMHVKFELPSREGRLHIARRIVQDELVARQLADDSEGMSIAQTQNLCYLAVKD